LPAPFESVHRYLIQVPLTYRLPGDRESSIGALPADCTIRSKWGSFIQKVRADPKDAYRIEVEFRTRLEKTRVEPADFDAFRKFREEVLNNYRVSLAFMRTDEPADIPALEAQLALAPGDSVSARALARLYYKLDKAKDAGRVLRAARYYSPQDA